MDLHAHCIKIILIDRRIKSLYILNIYYIRMRVPMPAYVWSKYLEQSIVGSFRFAPGPPALRLRCAVAAVSIVRQPSSIVGTVRRDPSLAEVSLTR